MSMETHVFFRAMLPSKAALARAMKELGFPFSITPASGSLEQQSGFMPMRLRGEETGVEFDIFSDHLAVEEFADKGVDQSFERRASFRWGGSFEEAVAGMCSAAALAKLVNGVVFDEAENRLLSSDDAIALARRNLAQLSLPEDKPRQGTRPADIKRYLKPLMKRRSDLALVGRHFIIRPVRHLLRGAFLDRTSDKYQFQIWPYIVPLYNAGVGVGYGRPIHGVRKVWEPHFVPLLLDSLADDVFDQVAKVTTLEDFAHYVEWDANFQGTQCEALLLAGRRDLAVQLVDATERDYPDHHYWPRWVQTYREEFARDPSELCEAYRAKEGKRAKELKLGDIWQPAPFPVEVDEGERAVRCAEPRFSTEPWIPPPPGIVQEAPQQSGDVMFAEAAIWRRDRFVLQIPLTCAEAEAKHRSYRDYVLVTRLSRELVLALHHRTGWNPDDPDHRAAPDYVPPRGYRLEAYGVLGRLQALIDERFKQRGIFNLWNIQNFDRRNGNTLWHAHNSFDEKKKNIRDERERNEGHRSQPLTDADVALCVIDAPPFGDFNDLWRRVETYLQNEGFGTFF
jgi:hypothetical protein